MLRRCLRSGSAEEALSFVVALSLSSQDFPAMPLLISTSFAFAPSSFLDIFGSISKVDSHSALLAVFLSPTEDGGGCTWT